MRAPEISQDSYLTDVPYTFWYFHEQSPLTLNLTCILRRIHAPDLAGPFTYCDLGCGHGVTASFVAAAFPKASVYGVDFNPAHIAHARALAGSLPNATFLEKAFEQLHATDLPEFDYVALHGILSWISPATRDALIGFLAAKLKPGGLCYVSYNALPGKLYQDPIRHLISEFAARKPGDRVAAIGDALAAVKSLAESGLGHFQQNTRLGVAIDQYSKKNTNYVAHEFGNDHWRSYYFSEVVRELRAAKLSFVGSAVVAQNLERLNCPPEGRKALEGVTDPILHEALRDFLIDTGFRKDVFIKGPRSIPPQEQARAIDALRVARAPFLKPGMQARIPAGNLKLDTPAQRDLMIAVGQSSPTIAELIETFRGTQRSPGDTRAAVIDALAGNQLTIGPEPVGAVDRPGEGPFGISALNRRILQDRLAGIDIQVLFSPICGSLVVPYYYVVDAATRMPLAEIPQRLSDELIARRIAITTEGRVIKARDEQIAYLTERVEEFRKDTLPELLRARILHLGGSPSAATA